MPLENSVTRHGWKPTTISKPAKDRVSGTVGSLTRLETRGAGKICQGLATREGPLKQKKKLASCTKPENLRCCLWRAQLQDMAEHVQQLSAIKRQNSLDIFCSHFLIIRCVGLLSRQGANEGGWHRPSSNPLSPRNNAMNVNNVPLFWLYIMDAGGGLCWLGFVIL